MKYYFVNLGHSVLAKFKAETKEIATRKLKTYINYQNKGEAKSDRLFLKSFTQVGEIDYNSDKRHHDYLIK